MGDAESVAGRFMFDPETGKWDWDDGVFRLHGLEPGALTPTTDFVLGSKHPDDRGRVRELLERVGRHPEPFSISFRLVGQDGLARRVVVVGESVDAQRVEGYYIDLEAQVDREIDLLLEDIVEHRAMIEQAKGILMAVYSLTDAQAFALLRWWSSNRNVKIRELSASLVEAVSHGALGDIPTKESVDRLLHDLTV